MWIQYVYIYSTTTIITSLMLGNKILAKMQKEILKIILIA